MATTKETQERFGQFTGKGIEGLALWAEANQKILRDLADLSSVTAKESVRLYALLQASALEAAKAGLGEIQKDPFAWYQKSLLDGIEATQKAFKLLEGNAQVITQSAERLQASAEQVGKEIQQTFATLGSGIKALYTTSAN